MAETTSTGLLEQLNRNSVPYRDPLERVRWDQLDRRALWLPEPALSLYGVPEYRALGETQRHVLSQYEFIHFLTAGLWLEGIFMHRIARTAARPVGDLTRQIYHLHELREEAGHSLMFLELMRRADLPLPRAPFWRPDIANLLGRYAPFDSVAFWAAVLIGEEIPDRVNRYIRKHRDEVCPAAYDIATAHIIDEARHIAHARETVEAKLDAMPRWQKAAVKPVLSMAFRQFIRLLYFPPAQLYELAGLTPGRHWARLARDNPYRRAFVDETLQSTLRVLRDHGLSVSWS